MSDDEQSPLLPETTRLPVLQSGGEIVPAVPGCAAKDECSAAPVVHENAPDVRPNDDQTDSAGKKPRLNAFWQANTAEAIRLWKSGKSGGEIGAILGTSRSSVIGRMRRLGLLGSPERMNAPIHKWTPGEDAELTQFITVDGLGYVEIAAAMNATYDSVRHRAQRLGIRAKPIWNSSRKGTMRRAPRLVIPAADPPDPPDTSMAVHILDTTR